MSVPTVKQAYAFLNPLRGRSSAILVANRDANAAVTKFALGCLAESKVRTVLLDTSCFYGTNIQALTEGIPREFLERTTLLTIPEGARPEAVLTELMANPEAKAILIDDLNSLNALMSEGDAKSSIHELFVLIRMLSYYARINGIVIFATVYKSQRSDSNSRRSLAAAADFQIETETEPSSITFRCESVGVWPAKKFVATVRLLGGQDVDADIESRHYQE
jgi:hypothetical protein